MSRALKFLLLILLLSGCSVAEPELTVAVSTPGTTNTPRPTSTPPPTPIEAPSFDTATITLKASNEWSPALQKEYATYLADPFGIGVLDGSYSETKKAEWLSQRDAVDAQIDAGWKEDLTNNTNWQAKIAEWGLAVPDITQWDTSLTSADKLLMVKAYWKANDIMEGNLPTKWIIDAHNNPANYPAEVIKNHWLISGFGKDSTASAAAELTATTDQTKDWGKRGLYAMYGESIHVPWATTYGYFTTRDEGVIGLVHIAGLSREKAMELWLDVPDRRPIDQFRTIAFQPLSKKGSVCPAPGAGGAFVETACGPADMTPSGVGIGDGGAIDTGGIKTTADPDVLLDLLQKCATGSCQLRTFSQNDFVNGGNVVLWIDFNQAPPQ